MMLWNVDNAGGKSSDMAMRIGALVMNDPVRKRRQWVVLANDEHSGWSISAVFVNFFLFFSHYSSGAVQ